MSAIRSRLTFANVMASIAVFGVLAGGAYAAATIGPKDIKKDAVRTKHIKNGQVGARDLNAVVKRPNSSAGTSTPRTTSVNCESDEQVIGGGGGIPSPGAAHTLARSEPLSNGWSVTAHGSGTWTLQVYALCLQK
jgi:hypothetical protein